MKRSYKKVVCDYVFSTKSIEDFPVEHHQVLMLAKDVLTSHGMGGKFMETLLLLKLKMIADEKIHGWDAWSDNRPVEMKTETINNTKKLYAESSYPTHTKGSELKRDMYLREKPILVNCGVCAETGKCLYIMCTDTGKISSKSKFFVRLSANSPRINFGHYKEETSSYEIVYRNKTLIRQNLHEVHENFKDVVIGL